MREVKIEKIIRIADEIDDRYCHEECDFKADCLCTCFLLSGDIQEMEEEDGFYLRINECFQMFR